MVRKKFWSKREKVIGGWGKVHSNELHDLYLSLNIIHVKKIKDNRKGGLRETNEEEENAYLILEGKPEGKKPFERYGARREHNN
jgi:hypothetical protein